MKRSILYLLPIVVALLASCGRAERMRAMLEQAEWMNRNDSLFTSDSVGRALVRYYDHWWHSSDLRLRAYYMLGCAYRDMGNAPRALENFQYAVAQVDTLTAPDSTLNRLMRVHSQMSQIYLQQRLSELEEQELQTAERLAWRTGDTLSALIFKERECNILYNLKEYERCVQEALMLHEQYIKYGYPNQALLSYGLCIKTYLALKDYPKALFYIKQCEKCPYFYSCPEKTYAGIYGLYLLQGQFHLGIEQVDSAISYFNNTLSCPNNDAIRLLAYKGLFQSYTLSGNIDSISKYASLYSDAKEKNYNEEIGQASIQAKALYNYTIEQQIAQQKKDENTRLYVLLLFLTFTAIAIILSFMYRNEKRKREISELHKEHEIALRELEETENSLAVLNKERAADKNLIAIFLHDKEKLATHIAYLEKELLKTNSRKWDVDLSRTEIVKKFRIARQHGMVGEYRLSDEDWEQLRATVESIYPTFFEAMNARQRLSVKDYRTCLLVKAKFAPSDINILMGQTESYSTQTKKRLHKKVFGSEGTAAEFEQKVNHL